MSKRLVSVLALTCACSPVDGPEGALGGGNFGAGTTGGPGAGPQSPSDDDGGSSSSGGADESTTGAQDTTGGDDESSSTGAEDDGFTLGPGLYVSELSGADSNDGSREAPMRTIPWALQEAQAQDRS